MIAVTWGARWRLLRREVASWMRAWRWTNPLRCGWWVWGVRLESSRTQYAWDGPDDVPEDPNRSQAYCRPCAEEHHAYWDEMWDDYNSGRL